MSSLWAVPDPETEAEMLRMLRNASVARRFELVEVLTCTVVSLSRRAIAVRHPEWSEQEVLLEWVGLHYGRPLERELRDFLAKPDAGSIGTVP